MEINKADTILAMFKENEKEAFQLLYDTYYGTLVLFANQIINDTFAAEDIVQKFLVQFWMTKRYRTLPFGLDKYVFQAIKFSSLNYLREKQRHKNLHEKVLIETVDEEQTDDQRIAILELVYQAIELLPEERRRIFFMVFVDGLSYQEVADRLHISKNTVKTQLGRSLKFLRDTLKDKYFSLFLLFLLKK